MKDDKIVFQKSYGIINIDIKQNITASSNFNICSLTKQFTAVAILQLAEKNKLTLNDKLSRFFPDMNKKVADVVTVKELLTHSSGIVDHYDYTNTTGMMHAHNIDVYKAIKNVDSTYFIPGTKFRYSNTAYCLLALIIEKLSGLNYNEYMKENIFKPAGMMHTIIWNENVPVNNEVTGYDLDSASHSFNVAGPDESIFFSTEGDGGVYTSINDYIKWFQALQSSKIFSKSITDQARSMQFIIDKEKKVGYGFGWFIDKNDSQEKVYHSGSNGGFRTYSFTIPSKNILIVILSNRDDIDLEKLVQEIIHIELPSLKPFIKIEDLTS
jgi:CubicO group peptidase (beta-lactamase class C family)